MISVYLIIAIVCAILLVLSLALGGLAEHDIDMGGHEIDLGGGVDGVDAGGDYGDFHGAGISPLSLPIVLAFGTTFGGLGAVLEQLEFHPYVIPLISVLVSVVISGVIYVVISRVFVRTQASSNININTLIGTEGTVNVAIQPGKTGQILVITHERGRTLIPAISNDTIPTDTIVRIESFVGSTAKVVRK